MEYNPAALRPNGVTADRHIPWLTDHALGVLRRGLRPKSALPVGELRLQPRQP